MTRMGPTLAPAAAKDFTPLCCTREDTGAPESKSLEKASMTGYVAVQHTRKGMPSMTTAEAKLNPVELWTASFAAWTDLSRSASEAWLETVMSMHPDSEKTTSEDLTRDVFRKLADLNLQHWENTAKVLEAMPSWMRWPQTVPGGVLTDWFDQARRNGPQMGFSNMFDMSRFVTVADGESLSRPVGLEAPDGSPDDLTRIKGIGPKLSQTLNDLGIYHFRQIAAWEDGEAKWIDDFLAFKGRVAREQWIEQAQKFMSNGQLH